MAATHVDAIFEAVEVVEAESAAGSGVHDVPECEAHPALLLVHRQPELEHRGVLVGRADDRLYARRGMRGVRGQMWWMRAVAWRV